MIFIIVINCFKGEYRAGDECDIQGWHYLEISVIGLNDEVGYIIDNARECEDKPIGATKVSKPNVVRGCTVWDRNLELFGLVCGEIVRLKEICAIGVAN